MVAVGLTTGLIITFLVILAGGSVFPFIATVLATIVVAHMAK